MEATEIFVLIFLNEESRTEQWTPPSLPNKCVNSRIKPGLSSSTRFNHLIFLLQCIYFRAQNSLRESDKLAGFQRRVPGMTKGKVNTMEENLGVIFIYLHFSFV